MRNLLCRESFILFLTTLFAAVSGQAQTIEAPPGLKQDRREVEIITLEDGTKEVQPIRLQDVDALPPGDAGHTAIKAESSRQIRDLLDRARQDAVSGRAAALQREIEAVKRQEEIQHLSLMEKRARERGHHLLADELREEISRQELMMHKKGDRL